MERSNYTLKLDLVVGLNLINVFI